MLPVSKWFEVKRGIPHLLCIGFRHILEMYDTMGNTGEMSRANFVWVTTAL